MEKKTYPENIEIIREGMDGTHMYILEKGEVSVTKVSTVNPILYFTLPLFFARMLLKPCQDKGHFCHLDARIPLSLQKFSEACQDKGWSRLRTC